MPAPATPTPPSQPTPAASAVLIRGDQVLMVKRGRPPNAGLWSFPGGKIHLGERVNEAVRRELYEETGIEAEVDDLISVLDIMGHEDRQLQYHYLLVVMRCRWISGDPVAADDAAEARWVPIERLRSGDFRLTDTVLPVLERALGMSATRA